MAKKVPKFRDYDDEYDKKPIDKHQERRQRKLNKKWDRDYFDE